MKILAIRLKNLTSIEGTVEVDFTKEPLQSAGIFAISGATGAGKSTILDALCLALYDKAPRYANSVENISLTDVGENQISQSDVRNLLRRGVGEGYAEVDFLGVTGERFRTRWAVRRTRYKADGSLQNQTVAVWNLDKNEELQGSRKELLAQLVGLIGLTYEQFTRTVLLAQNDFATFLKSRGTAKAELLEKLTGTDIYSRISQEVFASNKAVQEEVGMIRNRLSLIEQMPEEEYQTLLNERLLRKQMREQSVKHLIELNRRWNVLCALKTQEELLKSKQQTELTETQKRRVCVDALATQEEEYARFKAQWESIQPELNKARQLDAQIQIQKEICNAAAQSRQKAKEATQEQEKRVKAADQALQEAQRALGETGQLDKIDVSLHQEEVRLNTLQRENDALLQRLNAFGYPLLMEEQNRLEKELLLLQNIRQLKADGEKAKAECESLEKEARLSAKELIAKEAEQTAVRQVYENARITIGKDVKALRRQLREGEACPVCGSRAHPYRTEESVVDALYHDIEQAYTNAEKAYQSVNNRAIAIQKDLEHRKQLAEQYASQLSILQKEPSTTADEEQIKSRREELSLQINAYRQIDETWKEQEEAVRKLRAHCESLRVNVTRCRLLAEKAIAMKEQFSLLEAARTTEEKRFQLLSGELAKLQQERSGLLRGKSAEEAQAAVSKREKELMATLEQTRKEAEQAQTRISGVQGEIKQLSASVEEWLAQRSQMEDPERLPELIEKQEEENRNLESSYSSIEARILQYEKNKADREKILKELEEKEQVSDRWAKLNKLIGSADGAKFKIIAQSYTLNLLLYHANHHLSYLSRRYQLQQIPDTLGLQIIDREMCDEIRTVYSLSGGESFLISLALALGLSSLSSNNLKVESLFIDEGFGSLDADSLRTAMEALEQLQMQGRKIGVISHVQEMSERISVQIRIEKKISGKSVLTVEG